MGAVEEHAGWWTFRFTPSGVTLSWLCPSSAGEKYKTLDLILQRDGNGGFCHQLEGGFDPIILGSSMTNRLKTMLLHTAQNVSKAPCGGLKFTFPNWPTQANIFTEDPSPFSATGYMKTKAFKWRNTCWLLFSRGAWFEIMQMPSVRLAELANKHAVKFEVFFFLIAYAIL